MTKFLFKMESVGSKHWANRHKIVKAYNYHIDRPIVYTKSSCGISKADFDMILMELKQKGVDF